MFCGEIRKMMKKSALSVAMVIALPRAKFLIRHVFQPNSTDMFFYLFLHERIWYGYSLEVPHWGASKKCPQHKLLWRNKKKYVDTTAYLELGMEKILLALLYLLHIFRY